MKHRFNKEKLLDAWCFWNRCLWCGEYGANAFHHIISPSSMNYKAGKFNNSLFNSCPIHNHKCHLYNGKLHDTEQEKRLLKKAMRVLLNRQSYTPTEKDARFYLAYKDLYKGG